LPLSGLLAPPYDVLDEASKRQLQARHPNNIVTVDLPFTPPKSVGPDEVYTRANETLHAWISGGILRKDSRPAMYPYMQSYEHNGRTYHRKGFICLVRLSPFGTGHVVPHEKTYAGPIEDRLRLMRHTGVQLSPIFGLYSDPRHEVTRLLFEHVGKPEADGVLDGVHNKLWSVIDANIEHKVIDLLGLKPVYIADGHHRYTTALHYQHEMERAYGGPLPPSHPANWCMFVLVGMQDDGLIVLPTHRLLGNIPGFHPDALFAALGNQWDVSSTPLTPDHVDEYAATVLPLRPVHTFGLYCARTARLYQLTLKNPDLLAPLEPNQSDSWRRLDVAILHRYLIDEIIGPRFALEGGVRLGYTADAKEVVPKTDGATYQAAVLLKSTPLGALEQLGRHGEVMPQKSTYFYPKLATGMTLYPLQ
jgi:uncharacterized protein (DUF1015 family)